MKLTYEQKLQAYNDYMNNKKGMSRLAKELNVSLTQIQYFIYLAKRHGTDILRHNKQKHYPNEEKLRIINRVLINKESIFSVSIDEGLSGTGTLPSWIKSYKENGYNIINKRKGRKPYGQEENNGGTIEGKQATSAEELKTSNRELILKKIGRLNSREKEARKEDIVEAITELRQELNCSLKFILETIESNKELPSISKSDYYYLSSPHHEDKDLKNDEIMNKIIEIFYDNYQRYGYRRITLELRNLGYHINNKAVKRLMSKMDLYAITPRAKYKSYKGDMNGTVKNLLLDKKIDKNNNEYLIRNFKVTRINEKWTTDISEFHIAAGKLYLSPIMDMYTKEIVSYVISRSPNYAQVNKMLNIAFNKFDSLEGLIFHSDQGWQYQMAPYHQALQDRGIRQSMSRKGNCYDNCIIENFFGKMKNEMFYGYEYTFKTLDELEEAMKEYIEYYNNKRIQVKLKGLTPAQAREQALKNV